MALCTFVRAHTTFPKQPACPVGPHPPCFAFYADLQHPAYALLLTPFWYC